MDKKIVFITGGSSGMGKITAKKLNKSGYKVYTGARRIENMIDLNEEGISTFKLDLTEDESIKKAVDCIIKEEGKIDILINNAGYGSYGAIEDVSLEEAKRQFEVNLFGLARLTQLVLPHMRKQKYGKIVNLSSIGGKMANPLGGWYHASKFALEGLSDSLRLEVKDFGIDVIVIEPGGIKTEWSNITANNLKQSSGNTAYKNLAFTMSNMFSNSSSGSEPEVITNLIQKAIIAKDPKPRYAGGFGSKPILFFKKVLPDKTFDKLWMLSLKLMGKNNGEIAELKAKTN